MTDARYLGIDPGSDESGWCEINSACEVIDAGKQTNSETRAWLRSVLLGAQPATVHVVIENMQSYGGQVGRSTLDTCIEIGRFIEVCERYAGIVHLIPRPEYARWMADGARKVNDSVLRQALLLRYGGDRKGEPLHALKGASDKRSAFAVAAYAIETGKVA